MTDATAEQAEETEKSGKKGLVVGVILALVGAAGGYGLTMTGLLPFGGNTPKSEAAAKDDAKAVKSLPEVGFIDLPPIIVSVDTGESRHLKFHAQLEVNAPYTADVEHMQPRIIDLMNSYLRAIELSDLEDPLALMRIRGHLLRRIGIVVGEGRVRDVLIAEFVLN